MTRIVALLPFIFGLLLPGAPGGAEDPAKARLEIRSRTDGLVLSRRVYKYVTAGLTVAKIVGTRPLAHRKSGDLLEK